MPDVIERVKRCLLGTEISPEELEEVILLAKSRVRERKFAIELTHSQMRLLRLALHSHIEAIETKQRSGTVEPSLQLYALLGEYL